jgi:hypothetical protein
VAAIVLTGTNAKRVAAAAKRVEQVARVRSLVWGGEEASGPEPRSAEMRTIIQQLRPLSRSLELPALFYTAGFHPHDAKHATSADLSSFAALLAHAPACVAVGECGLDYDRMFSPRHVQLQVLEQHLALALAHNKSLFIHERDRDAAKGAPLGSFSDLLASLDKAATGGALLDPSRVCVHCWTGSEEQLCELVRRGYMIGLLLPACLRAFACMHWVWARGWCLGFGVWGLGVEGLGSRGSGLDFRTLDLRD